MNRNLLIVDDEIEILEWLQELFTYDFDREVSVYTAKSAREALDMLNSIRFDLVLTDIKMPGMDGITLFEKIKENWPKCKTVFLTGYRNFDDLYRVMNHRDVKYILKTEGDHVIMAAVRESYDALEQEMEAARRQMDEEKRMEKARYWMRRDLMDQVFSGEIPEDLQEQMRQNGIELDAEKEVQTCLLRIDSPQESIRNREPAYLMETLIESVRSNQPPSLKFYLHPSDRQHAVLLVQPSSEEETDWSTVGVLTEGMLEYAQEFFRSSVGMTVSAILYPGQAMLSEMGRRIPVLRMSMNHYVGSAQEMIYRIPEGDMLRENAAPASCTGQISSLLRLMELRKEKEFFEQLRPYLEEIAGHSGMHDPKALEIYYAIAIHLLQFINENRLNEAIASRTEMYKLTNAEGHGSGVEAAQYLSDVSRAIYEQLEGNESNLSNRLLTGVIRYIDEHLDGDLSLNQLAQVGGFNASYLSRLFKQITGQGPSEYILRKRMDLAKTLLSDTNEKIQDIAAKTGYLSAHSFTRTFRTETGLSPTEWRNSNPGGTSPG
ncbi:MAG: AraC family transcriptional regulator [Clostridia bacterium]|nr:AraC family transcriptional regulator [Clostridia bacterium]